MIFKLVNIVLIFITFGSVLSVPRIISEYGRLPAAIFFVAIVISGLIWWDGDRTWLRDNSPSTYNWISSALKSMFATDAPGPGVSGPQWSPDIDRQNQDTPAKSPATAIITPPPQITSLPPARPRTQGSTTPSREWRPPAQAAPAIVAPVASLPPPSTPGPCVKHGNYTFCD